MNIQIWLEEITEKLKESFGKRLLFVGIQGSHVRGEATEASDIDLVVVLDYLEAADLKLYRALIQTMPHADKACGFTGGKAELLSWPKHELLQFKMETKPCYGSLDGILPELSAEDIRLGICAGAAGLYHAACHSYVHSNPDDYENILRQLYKACFFVAQAQCYYESGKYCMKKAELKDALQGEARELIDQLINWPQTGTDELFSRLINYSGGLIRKLRPDNHLG